MPDFTQQEKDVLFKLPRSPKDLSDIINVIEGYAGNYYWEVLGAF